MCEEELAGVLRRKGGEGLRVLWAVTLAGKPHIGHVLSLLKIADLLEAGCEVRGVGMWWWWLW